MSESLDFLKILLSQPSTNIGVGSNSFSESTYQVKQGSDKDSALLSETAYLDEWVIGVSENIHSVVFYHYMG